LQALGPGGGKKRVIKHRLPANWERKKTSEGISFYIDHTTKLTQWEPPPLLEVIEEEDEEARLGWGESFWAAAAKGAELAGSAAATVAASTTVSTVVSPLQSSPPPPEQHQCARGARGIDTRLLIERGELDQYVNPTPTAL